LEIGANLGNRERNFEEARSLLSGYRNIHIERLSPVYETEPVGYFEQPLFLNAVIEIGTSLEPFELLKIVQTIEEKMGRERRITWGPRTIDLDLLLYGTEQIDSPNLTIPHPRMCERKFVLVPLNDLCPELVIPGVGESVRSLLKKCCDRSQVRPYSPLQINWEQPTIES
jgi:2-amino-4-hydroxy-6-hydroxymethyldihydropteridine diphosphokinase